MRRAAKGGPVTVPDDLHRIAKEPLARLLRLLGRVLKGIVFKNGSFPEQDREGIRHIVGNPIR
jgi:hypothetical protein